MIQIQNEAIDTNSITEFVGSEDAGAVVLFVGTTRRMTNGKETLRLEYDCYKPMATAELGKLRTEALQRWPLTECAIVHRTGVVENGQASVAVAVSSPHRVDAFEAAQWIMDKLKRTVPIWKKEQWADGSTEWVHPESKTDDPKNQAGE
jgi:molybdopterin synthase catalytic subunit